MLKRAACLQGVQFLPLWLREGRTSRGPLAPNSGLNKKNKTRSIWPWLLSAAVVVVLSFFLLDGVVQEGEEREESGEFPIATSLSSEDLLDAPGRQELALNSGWELVDPASVDELPAYKEVVPGRALVRILDAINDWKSGRPGSNLGIPQLGAEFEWRNRADGTGCLWQSHLSRSRARVRRQKLSLCHHPRAAETPLRTSAPRAAPLSWLHPEVTSAG